MKILIDTHAFLWLLADDPRLSQTARTLFLDRTHDVHLSVASLWEITIKISPGKLTLAAGWYDTLIREMQVNAIHWLPVDSRHCVHLEHLPLQGYGLGNDPQTPVRWPQTHRDGNAPTEPSSAARK